MEDRPLTVPFSLTDTAGPVLQPVCSIPAPTMAQPPEIPAREVTIPVATTIIVPPALTPGLSTTAEVAEAHQAAATAVHPTTAAAATMVHLTVEGALPVVEADDHQVAAAVHAVVADDV